MAKAMKLFQPTEKMNQLLGIQTFQPKLKDRVSFKWLFLLISMTIYSISSSAFFMLEAESVTERGDSFYEATSDISCIFHIITYCREAPELRQLITKFENFFEESQFWLCVRFFKIALL